MEEKLQNQTISIFAEDLASKAPVPGGGGAAALCGAVGTALSSMTASLTAGKKKYADVSGDMEDLIRKADVLRADLLELIDKDAEAFGPLSKAYGLPHETDEEKALKAQVMEEALKMAAEAPFKIMEKTALAIELSEAAAGKGSKIVLSDAGCSAAILQAAIKAASLNVYANTRLMKDREYAEDLERKTRELLEEYVPRADRVFDMVSDFLTKTS